MILTTPQSVRSRIQIGAEQYLDYDLYYVTRPQDLAFVVDWMRGQKAYAVDIETGGTGEMDGLLWHRGKIATLQVGNPLGDRPTAFVLDVRAFTPKQLQPLIDELNDPRAIKLGQNLKFECLWLQYHYGIKLRNVADCFITELVVRAGLFPITAASVDGAASRKAYTHCSMESLCLRYLKVQIDKDRELRTGFYKTSVGKHNQRQLEYAAGDVIYPFYIAQLQKRLVRDRGLATVLNDVEFPMIPILADSEIYGIGLDVPAWRKLWQTAIAKQAEAKAALDKFFLADSAQLDLLPSADNRPTAGLSKTTREDKVVGVAIGGQALEATTRRQVTVAEINYNSPDQVKKALARYCKRINWPVEVVTTYSRLMALKRLFGKDWLEKKQADGAKNRLGKAFTEEDIPDWLIPEEKYVLLLKVDAVVLTLAKIRKQLPADVVDAYLEYKEYAKKAGTYGMEFVKKHVWEDGRIHTNFHQALTSTGRISTEPNLQNIPSEKAYRWCFKPKKGYAYIIADYSQIEPRISAEESQDPVYLNTYRVGADLYISVAEAMTGRTCERGPDGELTPEWVILRTIFKTVVLALAYRMGPRKLRDRLTLALETAIMTGQHEQITLEFAKELHERFFRVHGGIREYQDLCSTLADPTKTTRPKLWDEYMQDAVTYVRALCGRLRFFRADSLTTYTEAPNAPIQGHSATITKYAAVLIQKWLDENQHIDAHGVNYVHDEIVYECPIEHAAVMAKVVKTKMEEAGQRWLKSVPVKAEFPKKTDGVVDRWLKEAV